MSERETLLSGDGDAGNEKHGDVSKENVHLMSAAASNLGSQSSDRPKLFDTDAFEMSTAERPEKQNSPGENLSQNISNPETRRADSPSTFSTAMNSSDIPNDGSINSNTKPSSNSLPVRLPDSPVPDKGWSKHRMSDKLTCDVTTGSVTCNTQFGCGSLLLQQDITPGHSSIDVSCDQIPRFGRVGVGICPEIWDTDVAPGTGGMSVGFYSDGDVWVEGEGGYDRPKWRGDDVIRCVVSTVGESKKIGAGEKIKISLYKIDGNGNSAEISSQTHTISDRLDEDSERKFGKLVKPENIKFKFVVYLEGQGTRVKIRDFLPLNYMWHPEGMYGDVTCDGDCVVSVKDGDDGHGHFRRGTSRLKSMNKLDTHDSSSLLTGIMCSRPINKLNNSATIKCVKVNSGSGDTCLGVKWGRECSVTLDERGRIQEKGKSTSNVTAEWKTGDTVSVVVTDMGGQDTTRVGDSIDVAFFLNGAEKWRNTVTLDSDDSFPQAQDHEVFNEAVFQVKVSHGDKVQILDVAPAAFETHFELWSAVMSNDVDKIEYLLKLHDESDFVNSRNGKGQTPLHVMCIRRQADIVKQILDHQHVNVNIPCKKGNTPLHSLCSDCSDDCKVILNILLKRPKLDMNVKNNDGDYPIDIVLANKNLDIDIVKAFVEYPYRSDSEGYGPDQTDGSVPTSDEHTELYQESLHKAILRAVIELDIELLKYLLKRANFAYEWNITHDQIKAVYEKLSEKNTDMVRFISTFIFKPSKHTVHKHGEFDLTKVKKFTESVLNTGEIPITEKHGGAAFNIYLAAILFNNVELSQAILPFCPSPTMMALFGASLLKRLEEKVGSNDRYMNSHKLRQDLLDYSESLQKCAVYLLSRVPVLWENDHPHQNHNSDDTSNQDELTNQNQTAFKPDRYIMLSKSADVLGKWWTPLRIIQHHELKKAASSPSVQKFINDVWNGCKDKDSGTNSFLTRTFLPPSPKCKMATNVIGNFFVLMLFSIFLLTDFRDKSPSWKEIIVTVWYFCYFIEECRQIFYGTESPPSHKSKRKFLSRLWNKIGIWFADFWNKMDLVLFVMYLSSCVLRVLIVQDNSLILWAKFTFCISLILASLRCLHYFYVFELLGPKVVMIVELARLLLKFLVLMAVPIFSFGVTYTSLNNHFKNSTELSFDLISETLTFPTFQMFGELSLDELVMDSDKDMSTNTGDVMVNGYMMKLLIFVYILLSNAILMNVLTASVFNDTLSAEKEKTQVWQFHRIALVQEFHRRSIIPPFVVIDIVINLGIFIHRCCRSPATGDPDTNIFVNPRSHATDTHPSATGIRFWSFVMGSNPWENAEWDKTCISKVQDLEKQGTFEFLQSTVPHHTPKDTPEQILNDVYFARQDMNEKIDNVTRDLNEKIDKVRRDLNEEIDKVKEGMNDIREDMKKMNDEMRNDMKTVIRMNNEMKEEILAAIKQPHETP